MISYDSFIPEIGGIQTLGSASRPWLNGYFNTITTAESVVTTAAAATSVSSPKFIATGGTVPAVTNTTSNSCGTTAATITGADSAGKVVVGATSGTSCTVTFNKAFTNPPVCMASGEGTVSAVKAVSSATAVILSGTFGAGDVVNYTCIGI